MPQGIQCRGWEAQAPGNTQSGGRGHMNVKKHAPQQLGVLGQVSAREEAWPGSPWVGQAALQDESLGSVHGRVGADCLTGKQDSQTGISMNEMWREEGVKVTLELGLTQRIATNRGSAPSLLCPSWSSHWMRADPEKNNELGQDVVLYLVEISREGLRRDLSSIQTSSCWRKEEEVLRGKVWTVHHR